MMRKASPRHSSASSRKKSDVKQVKKVVPEGYRNSPPRLRETGLEKPDAFL